MKKRLVTTTILLLFLLPFVFADSVSTPSQATISPLGEATFNVLITNTEQNKDTFMLQLSDVTWSLRTGYTPDFTTGVTLQPGESKNIVAHIKPGSSITAGTYFVELQARSLGAGQTQNSMFIIRVDPTFVDYNITIGSQIIGSTSIDPSKTSSVGVLITNNYPVDLQNITVTAQSKFINKNVIVDVPPESTKIVEFSVNIDGSTPKQQDPINITVIQGNRVISSASDILYINEYKLPYASNVTVTHHFFYTVDQIIFTNTENAQKTQDAMVLKPSTSAILFTSPAATTTQFDNQTYFVWSSISLNPGQTYTVTIVEDYREIAIVIVIILILIIAYYSMRCPIIVKKKAFAIHKKDTGNNEIKVIIQLRNRSNRYIEQTRVLERLPIIHKVEPDFGPGTPEPKFRRHGNTEVILDWDIALAPKEERIFTYKIKSALPIVGEYTLHPTVVQYGKKNKRVASDPYRLVID